MIKDRELKLLRAEEGEGDRASNADDAGGGKQKREKRNMQKTYWEWWFEHIL